MPVQEQVTNRGCIEVVSAHPSHTSTHLHSLPSKSTVRTVVPALAGSSGQLSGGAAACGCKMMQDASG